MHILAMPGTYSEMQILKPTEIESLREDFWGISI